MTPKMPHKRVGSHKPSPKAHLLQDIVAEYTKNNFSTLPYDVKYYFLHSFKFHPRDLVHLSQVNQAWRECSLDDKLFDDQYKVRLMPIGVFNLKLMITPSSYLSPSDEPLKAPLE